VILNLTVSGMNMFSKESLGFILASGKLLLNLVDNTLNNIVSGYGKTPLIQNPKNPGP
jgi:hypothetical protein